MRLKLDAPFTMWEFENSEEAAMASMLSDLQVAHVQNELAHAAFERANLAVGENEQKFLRELEYIRGKMEMCSYLLVANESARNTMQEAMERQAAANPKETQT